jgi:biotin carboxylase
VPRGRLLLIGMGRMGRPYLDAAHRLGLGVSLVEERRRLVAPEVRERLGEDDRSYAVSGGTEDAWYAAALRAADDDVRAVVGYAEPQVAAGALVAEELGLPGPGLHAAVVSRNKHLQRSLFARHGLRQPEYHLGLDPTDAATWAGPRLPVVAKPLSESGSLGVEVLDSEDALRAWSDRAETSPILVEQYLAGAEYSNELLVSRGRIVFASVTRKVTTEPPRFVELEHHVPAGVDAAAESAMAELAGRVVAALGVGSGIVHLEVRLEEAGPAIMEVAVRTPGDYIMDVVTLARGIDMFAAVVTLAAGGEPDVQPTRDEAACSWFPRAAAGRVTTITGFEELRSRPGVVTARLRVSPGAVVRPLASSLDRVGAVVLHGSTPADVARMLAEAKALLRIETER